ncbi:MAG: GNAT family N-acetyltransferase [Gammaproteobacteria bacterium]|jgi:L-amino acid N-acyltransferase YncA|nr:GNAT family N-acetyltransferase [Gammaproteobacteria bacterium]
MLKVAGPEHYDAIIDIYNQAVRTGVQIAEINEVSVDDKRAWLDLHNGEHYNIFVAIEGVDENEQVVGYLALSPYRHGRAAFYQCAEISYYLDSHYQGRGLGTQLIDHAISQCPTLDITNLIAILLSCNTASIALLEKFGFEPWGLMPTIAKLEIGNVDHLYYGKKLNQHE